MEVFQSAIRAYDQAACHEDAAWVCRWIADCYEGLGDAEARIGAHKEGLRRFEELKDDRGAAWYLYAIGNVLAGLNRHAEALPCYERAAACYGRVDDRRHVARMLYCQGLCHRKCKDSERAIQVLIEAARRYHSLGNDKGEAESGRLLGEALCDRLRYNEAVRCFQAAADVYERLSDKAEVARAYERMGFAYAHMGSHNKAVGAYEEALWRFVVLRDDKRIAAVNRKLAECQAAVGDYSTAIRHVKDASDAHRRLNEMGWVAYCLNQLAVYYGRRHKNEEALQASLDSVSLYAGVKNEKGAANSTSLAAAAEYRMGHYAQAIAYHEKAASAYERLGLPVEAAWQLSRMADCRRELGQSDQAVALRRRLLDRFRNLGNEYGMAFQHEEIARSMVKQKCDADAVPEFEAAVAAYDRAGKSEAAAKAYLGLGECLERLGRHKEAEAALTQCMRRSSEGKDLDTYAAGGFRLAEILHQQEGARRAAPYFAATAAAYERSGYSMIHRRQYGDAIPQLEKAVTCYEHAGKPADVTRVSQWITDCKRRTGRLPSSTTRSASSKPVTGSGPIRQND